MATENIFLTARDYEIFRAIERCPLTVRQLRALSFTFPTPFGSDRRLQDRFAQLTHAGLLRRFRYAATEGSGQYYHTLLPESYRLLHGEDADLPSPGLFRKIGIARQHHTQKLADFIVRTVVAAHEARVTITEFTRENTLRLSVGEECLYPDGSFTLTLPDRPPFLFYVELDNSTEPLTSPTQRDSWLKKLRFYEALQNAMPTRFRVLGLITRSQQRLHNIATLAASVAGNPQRSLFLGVYLADYLQVPRPLTSPIFTDHRGLHVSLLPTFDLNAQQRIEVLESPDANHRLTSLDPDRLLGGFVADDRIFGNLQSLPVARAPGRATSSHASLLSPSTEGLVATVTSVSVEPP